MRRRLQYRRSPHLDQRGIWFSLREPHTPAADLLHHIAEISPDVHTWRCKPHCRASQNKRFHVSRDKKIDSSVLARFQQKSISVGSLAQGQG